MDRRDDHRRGIGGYRSDGHGRGAQRSSLAALIAVEVIAITSVAANLAAILGGILVFGEPIGSGTVGIASRLLAFCLVIAGAALVPTPLRARSGPV